MKTRPGRVGTCYCRVMDSDAINHFRAGREALVRKREQLTLDIAAVDRILGSMIDESPIGLGRADPPRSGLTFRDAAVQAVQRAGGRMKVSELLRTVSTQGVDIGDASARSMLAKLVQQNVLTNPSRGIYQLPDWVEP